MSEKKSVFTEGGVFYCIYFLTNVLFVQSIKTYCTFVVQLAGFGNDEIVILLPPLTPR